MDPQSGSGRAGEHRGQPRWRQHLAGYERSAARLGALADAVDVVCPGHNEAKVSVSLLKNFARAFAAIARGEAKATPERPGVVRYEAEGIVVLAREPKP